MTDIDHALVLNNRATWLGSLGYQNAASDVRRAAGEITRLRDIINEQGLWDDVDAEKEIAMKGTGYRGGQSRYYRSYTYYRE